ncbi:hypothetical protein MTX78_01710 [Hymenobacter tibetensis]|uniref:Macroglobulin domain-containing protein n=1 Tax=Hymenobacter tibetensis TaxID=497967 RepID=A0ABY4D2H3_9BACT|nr:hypothetical protein [Hymenobacter tibetensis]UOG75326.1 hypothetical protein MTX78_01710 [Hymenobacter tibetensis]
MALLLWLAMAGAAQAQTDSLGGITRKFSRYQQAALPEKLFLHLDRPVYLIGETMWFKVYAVEGTQATPLPLSTVAYVEVLDKQQRPVLQAKVPLKEATGHGSFVLPTSLGSGTYTVRAYTSWMQNFGPEYYFHSSITVLNTFTASGAVADKDSAAYDVQFFPEGGNLVQGIASKVAFKATAKSGTGVAVEGKVLNQSGTVVASFKTLRYGMGSFTFTPDAGSTYTAMVTVGKQVARYKLPRVYEQGYVMRLDNSSADPLTITVSSTSLQPETIFLLGHSRQKIAVTAQAPLVNGRAAFVVNKSQLLEGISHFTVFNAQQKPVCERLYFRQPTRQLTITARPDKGQYAPRDKVGVEIAATSDTRPLGAQLSMAVYRLDSLTTASGPDINSYLWLTSDLKGTVENPAYYCAAPSQEVLEAADNLMLTQGWSRFAWDHVLAPTPLKFVHMPEPNGLVVRGRLTKAGTTTPVKGVLTYLSTPSRLIRLNNSLSDAQGLLQFETNNFYGSKELVVQTDPGQDSTCRIEILNPFSQEHSATPPAPFSAFTRLQQAYAKRHFQAQVQTSYARKNEARYTAPFAVTDSAAFYGKPDETYFLDKYTRFKVLEEVMREYVPGVVVRIRKDGFHFLVVDKINKTVFTENPMVLLDGVPIFNINKMMAMNPLKIQKLEVIDSRYFQGMAVYSGVVSYTTYKGDLEDFPLDPRVLVQQYEGLQGQREFYAPRYDAPEAKRSRLPDMRNLLYWNPTVTTGTEASKLDFYTGDQAGRYVVVLQGLSGNGAAGSTSFTFEVKQAL